MDDLFSKLFLIALIDATLKYARPTYKDGKIGARDIHSSLKKAVYEVAPKYGFTEELDTLVGLLYGEIMSMLKEKGELGSPKEHGLN